MNPYLALKRAARKPIQPPKAGTKRVNSKPWNALEHDPPKEHQWRGRDGAALLFALGRVAFPEGEAGTEEDRTTGWIRRAALKEMRAGGRWPDGDPTKEDWWQQPEGW